MKLPLSLNFLRYFPQHFVLQEELSFYLESLQSQSSFIHRRHFSSSPCLNRWKCMFALLATRGNKGWTSSKDGEIKDVGYLFFRSQSICVCGQEPGCSHTLKYTDAKAHSLILHSQRLKRHTDTYSRLFKKVTEQCHKRMTAGSEIAIQQLHFLKRCVSEEVLEHWPSLRYSVDSQIIQIFPFPSLLGYSWGVWGPVTEPL